LIRKAGNQENERRKKIKKEEDRERE